jgi:hypothetical protein
LLERLFPLEDWREREADLPFEIPFQSGAEELWALVVVLIEHQSDTERLMPLRLLLFAVLYWERQWQEWKRLAEPRPTLHLRPVLPIVLYTSTRPWGSTRTLIDLLGEPAEFHAFAPQWTPLIWNLSEQAPEALLASTSEWLKALAVLRVEDVEAGAFRDVFTRAVQEIAPLAAADPVRWNDLMRMLLTWVFWRRPDAERAALVTQAVTCQADDLFRKEIQTMTNKLGPTLVELSVAEGERKGELRNARKLLRALLEDRFGPMPDALLKRIEASTDLERLQTAARQVYQIQKLDDLPLQ